MTIIIGTDEAGYGPNLGPLVIAASAWEVPDAWTDCDLYDVLTSSVCRDAADDSRLAIADSKVLYKPRGSLAKLEAGVYTALALLDASCNSWQKTFNRIHAGELPLRNSPWYCDYDENVPVDAADIEIQRHTSSLHHELQSQRIALVGLRAAVILPEPFNRRVRQLGSKGALLTEQTLQLVSDVAAACPAGDCAVYCDKHGGRNRYAAALQHTWPDSWIDIRAEGRALSEYALTIAGREARIRFAVGGESQLPSALASMTAKYLRELAMRAFNAFWQKEVPNLKPTAGYPVDARRFKTDIADAQLRLGIDDGILWRCK